MRFGRRKDPAEQVDSEQMPRDDPAENGPAVEQRLQELVELERATRDLFEQREAQQLEAWRAEADQRLGAAEALLAEAQTLEHQRHEAERSLIEMEKNLVDAWSEVARLRDELAEANRQADEARKEIKPRSERKIAEAESALAEVRAEVELERELRAELEERLETLEQSERQARETLEQQAVPAAKLEEAEQRVAELEEVLTGARDEAEREREQRGEMERRLEALVATEADADRSRQRQVSEAELKRVEAERAEREAQEALARVRAERDDEHKRLLAIDEELQALVTAPESARPALEDGPGPEGPPAEPPAPHQKEEKPLGEHEGSEAEEQEPERISEPVPPLLEALGSGQPRQATEPEPAEVVAEGEDEAPDPSEAEEGSSIGRGRRLGRGRRPQNRSITCAVCNRAVQGQSPKQLTAAGWIFAGEAALCPDCQRFGWQLPQEGGLPFRRSSAGQPSS